MYLIMIESVQRYPNVEYVFTNVPSDVDEPSLKKNSKFQKSRNQKSNQKQLTHLPMGKHHFCCCLQLILFERHHLRKKKIHIKSIPFVH